MITGTLLHQARRTAAYATFLILLLAATSAFAQRASPPRFEPASQPPTLLLSDDGWIAAGFAAGAVAMAPLDRSLARVLQDSSRQESRFLQRTAAGLRFLGFPGSVIIGGSVYAIGRLADDRRIAAFGLHGTEAIALSYVFVWVGKNAFGRARPYNDVENPFDFKLGRGFSDDRYQSFPSGHTAAAFAVAAALTAESGKIWREVRPYAGPVLYTGAALVGVSRMYHNRHWATDVVGGAAIGVLTGTALIRYLYSHDTRLDRWLLPSDNGEPQSAVAARSAHAPAMMIVWSYPAF